MVERQEQSLEARAREDALVVGTSAALNVRAAYELAKARPNQNLRIATFLCDHGSRYASKVFNAEFLASKNLVVRPLPAGRITPAFTGSRSRETMMCVPRLGRMRGISSAS